MSSAASGRAVPTWLAALPLLPATAEPGQALAAGAAALVLLAVARPLLSRLAAPRAPGTRWAATLVVLATLAAGLARALEVAWPALPPPPGGLAPALLAVGLLAGAGAGDAPSRPAREALAAGIRLALALLAIAGARAALGPAGDHAGTALAAAALLAALSERRRSPPTSSRPPPGAPS